MKVVISHVVKRMEEGRLQKIFGTLIVLKFRSHVMTHFIQGWDRHVWSLYDPCLQNDLNVTLDRENR